MPSAAHAAHRAQRLDTLIACALALVLIAGWILNFVSVRQLTLRLDSLVAASTRWA